ncbi:MAG: lysophospholipid acyltransferase family protein [Gemmatimonadota bacterium]
MTAGAGAPEFATAGGWPATEELWGRGRRPYTGVAGRAGLSYARATIRLLAIVAWTGAWYGALLAGWRLAPGSLGRRDAWRRLVFRRWARGVVRILGARITIRGNPPEGSAFLVSNHLSYFDIVVFASCMDTTFVAKREVASWPVLGPLARAMRTILVDRRDRMALPHVNAEIEQVILEGRSVILFPEGTSTPGHGILPLKPALLDWAARRVHPVHFATVSYRTAAGSGHASELVCWWGEMTLLSHLIDLAALPGFEATVAFGTAPLRDDQRGRLALRLREAMLRDFTPVTTHGSQ